MSQMGNEPVLVHAPYGRDAALISQFLERAGISPTISPTVESLCSALGESTGAALISDQSLTRRNVSAIGAVLGEQPPWSDLPLIVTISGGEATKMSQWRLDLLKPLGNISLLERPLRAATLVSAVKTALRARSRQYQLRDNFAERERLLRELERSNRELDQFAHIVSHDLQTPIRAVRAFSELLAQHYAEQMDTTADGFIRVIQDGAATMEALVRTLLNYASVGHNSMNVSNVSLTEVVGAVVTMLQPTIRELRAEVSYGDLPIIDCDPVLIRQIIQNLVGNALKYSDPKVPARIHISAQQTGRQCIVSVRDNGPGIAPEHHERVFLPLKRLHGKEIPGTGMGLALCRKIVERHGGEIWLNSEIGRGATFSFSLPVLQETKKKVAAGSVAGTGASAEVA